MFSNLPKVFSLFTNHKLHSLVKSFTGRHHTKIVQTNWERVGRYSGECLKFNVAFTKSFRRHVVNVGYKSSMFLKILRLDTLIHKNDIWFIQVSLNVCVKLGHTSSRTAALLTRLCSYIWDEIRHLRLRPHMLVDHLLLPIEFIKRHWLQTKSQTGTRCGREREEIEERVKYWIFFNCCIVFSSLPPHHDSW